MSQKIKIGSRGSKLALWQTYHIQNLLIKAGYETEICIIETKGDKILDQSLAQIGSKGLFTEELEEKLRSGEIDIAVHSAKDLQTNLGNDLEIIAYTEREKPNDVLVSLNPDFKMNPNGKGNVIGTSSTRRKAILRSLYPEVDIREARGNLQTRFRKMEEGQFEAMILAYAGVHRLNYHEKIIQVLPLNIFIPAAGQGSIAIEASTSLNPETKEIIRKHINHPVTETCLLAERAFLRKLEGGCSVPVFVLADLDAEQNLQISGGVIATDGSKIIQHQISATADKPEDSGIELAEMIIQLGALDLLNEIKTAKK